MNIEEILKEVPDKQLRWKGTTTLKWKKELYEFAEDKNFENVLEIGTNFGWTSYLLSFMATQVYTLENKSDSLEEAKKICKDRGNVTYLLGDAYKDTVYSTVPQELDAVVIDCVHTYGAVKKDIERAIKYRGKDKSIYLVFDDYSHPDARGVRQAIDEFLENGGHFERHIGHEIGYRVFRNDKSSFSFIGPEGIIVRYDG